MTEMTMEAAGGGGGGAADGRMGMMPPSPSPQSANCCMPADYMGGDDMTMHMSFFWGSRVEILFSRWPGNRGIGMYLLALLLVFATSALVDGLSSAIYRLSQRRPRLGGSRVPLALLLTAFHAVRVGLAYLVMLAVMSFNVGVLIAAIAGHALGFLLSGSGLRNRPGPNQPSNNGLILK